MEEVRLEEVDSSKGIILNEEEDVKPDVAVLLTTDGDVCCRRSSLKNETTKQEKADDSNLVSFTGENLKLEGSGHLNEEDINIKIEYGDDCLSGMDKKEYSIPPKTYDNLKTDKDRLGKFIKSIVKRDKGSIKAFSCDVCDKAFSQNSTLTRHYKVHTGEKPYECNYCAKTFSQRGNLIEHQKVHTGDKPFSCNVCKKAFSRKECLVIHERVHTGEKPFPCTVCGRSFSQKYDLSKHQLLHENSKLFSCDICGKSFKQKRYLSRHKKKH